MIELVPLTGGPSGRGKINQNGQFTIGTYEQADGASAGEYVVIIVQHNRPISREESRKLGPQHAEHADTRQMVSLKYASQATSDLSCTVSESRPNQFVFTVENQSGSSLIPAL